ncbi:hypothetical protein T484DRAFT_3642832 [Baffinella frigidus]|nr:hypothetical protein T484DRAFT_3642832 [Cryptophyta sp. CCMP2293]
MKPAIAPGPAPASVLTMTFRSTGRGNVCAAVRSSLKLHKLHKLQHQTPSSTDDTPRSPPCSADQAPIIRPSTHLTSKMTDHEFIRRVSSERRIAREALLDAVLSDKEPWSCIASSSTPEDALEAAHTEDQIEAVLEERILHSNITRLSRTFHGSSLLDIFAACTGPPPSPLPIACSGSAGSWRGAAPGSRQGSPTRSVCSPTRSVCSPTRSVCSSHAGEQQTEGLPDARRERGTVALRFKLARPASPSPAPAEGSFS